MPRRLRGALINLHTLTASTTRSKALLPPYVGKVALQDGRVLLPRLFVDGTKGMEGRLAKNAGVIEAAIAV
jgi:hypothetical protein